jgi:phosphatidylserine/phosphatidylglycerophosphate/cardiolipin synthase-like enzyme
VGRSPITILILCLIIGAAAYRYIADKRSRAARPRSEVAIKQDKGTAPPPAPPPAATKLPASIDVFFSDTYENDPTQAMNDPDNIDRKLAAFIATAHSTLDCAFYELESQRIADALIAAHLRGVKVRLVGDSDYRGNKEMKGVIAAGIPVVFDERSALMHNKFVVLDRRAVWTGSYNATDNCSFRNNNNGVQIRSADLAANYATEFAEMFERHEFGPKSTANTPHPTLKVGDADIYNYFAPEDDIPPKVIRFLKAARKSIHFMAFSFADDGIGDALIERRRAGLAVEGVVETRGSDGKGGEMPRLTAAGIPVLKDGNKYVMHHKVFIIDGTWTITGSYNFTGSAATSNDENILIIKSPAVAAKFEDEYKRIKRMAVDGGEHVVSNL